MLLKMLFLFCVCLNVSFLNSTPVRYWISPQQVKEFFDTNSKIYSDDLFETGDKSGVVELDEVFRQIDLSSKKVADKLVLNSTSTLFDLLKQSFGPSQNPPKDVEKFFLDDYNLKTHFPADSKPSNHWMACSNKTIAYNALAAIARTLCNGLEHTSDEENYLRYWVVVQTRDLVQDGDSQYFFDIACLVPSSAPAHRQIQDEVAAHYIQHGDFIHEIALPAGAKTKLFIICSVIVAGVGFAYDYLVNNF